jgi:hypothetical protein
MCLIHVSRMEKAVTKQYEKLPPHPITKEAQAYINSMTPEQKELHEMAQKDTGLGSSYFVERTKGFLDWASRNK